MIIVWNRVIIKSNGNLSFFFTASLVSTHRIINKSSSSLGRTYIWASIVITFQNYDSHALNAADWDESNSRLHEGSGCGEM